MSIDVVELGNGITTLISEVHSGLLISPLFDLATWNYNTHNGTSQTLLCSRKNLPKFTYRSVQYIVYTYNNSILIVDGGNPAPPKGWLKAYK